MSIHNLSLELKQKNGENIIVVKIYDLEVRVQGQEIVFNAGGREYRVRPKVGAGGIQREYSNLYYGSIVSYVVENNKLKATVTVGTPYNPFLGEFTIVYTYRDGKLVPQVVNFISLT